LSSDTSPTTVLFISTSLSGGGAERFVSVVASGLDRARFEASLCLFRDERIYRLADDVAVHIVERTRPWQIPIAVARLASLIDRARPDIVFSAFSHPSFMTGNALGRAHHRPLWIARVSSDPDSVERGVLRLWMRRLYRTADAIVSNSTELGRLFESAYPDAAAPIFIPNAVDFDFLERQSRQDARLAQSGRRRIVAVGRLSPEKRFDLLLRATARLADQHDVEVVICGEGRERVRLESLGRELGLEDRLRLPGFVANPHAWMASADVFVLCSDSEGAPNALIEAQGLGVAAVATDCPTGPREITDGGRTGRLVPTGDVDALAGAVAELLDDAEQRRALASAGRERVREQFDAAAVCRRLEDVFDRVSHG
jgi:glycosyltransferase involved in cell wall biosynthesis